MLENNIIVYTIINGRMLYSYMWTKQSSGKQNSQHNTELFQLIPVKCTDTEGSTSVM
jgi:hypothetical protein